MLKTLFLPNNKCQWALAKTDFFSNPEAQPMSKSIRPLRWSQAEIELEIDEADVVPVF